MPGRMAGCLGEALHIEESLDEVKELITIPCQLPFEAVSIQLIDKLVKHRAEKYQQRPVFPLAFAVRLKESIKKKKDPPPVNLHLPFVFHELNFLQVLAEDAHLQAEDSIVGEPLGNLVLILNLPSVGRLNLICLVLILLHIFLERPCIDDPDQTLKIKGSRIVQLQMVNNKPE